MSASSGKGPYLMLAAFWTDADMTDEVADAVSRERFPRVHGRRGVVVSFAHATADRPDFRRVMQRLDMAEVNERDYAGDDAA